MERAKGKRMPIIKLLLIEIANLIEAKPFPIMFTAFLRYNLVFNLALSVSLSFSICLIYSCFHLLNMNAQLIDHYFLLFCFHLQLIPNNKRPNKPC